MITEIDIFGLMGVGMVLCAIIYFTIKIFRGVGEV